jgi:antitoxin component of MazEF toxin-antitoxin module
MGIHRQITKIGGSLGVLVPRDMAEEMGIVQGSGVRLSLVGRQLVVEPDDDTIPEASFRRSFATVLRRYGPAFKKMADIDAGRTRR